MKANTTGKQRIRDPIHGLIVFGGSGDRHRDETDRIAWRLVNTREFQRLRRIRQLGFSDLVFPGAAHSRLAHSIGVYHTARRLADIIARQQGKRCPDRERVVLLAALLHDIGHGPFSHAFEVAAKEAGHARRHEDWSAEIVQGGTQVNRELRNADESLPEKIGMLLRENDRKDIYAAIVSSQFDADRLDYIQRDRLMTGVQFGQIDCDWLFDSLEVGAITVKSGTDVIEAPCLYLGPKGVQVAEEYLEARSRLYRMVYMHKTTRAAEKMLEVLMVRAAAHVSDGSLVLNDPVLHYLTSERPMLGAYLELDDATVFSALSNWQMHECQSIAKLARRLRERILYKCVDINDQTDGNIFLQFRRILNKRSIKWQEEILIDDASIASYEWYNFDDASALNKILVKTDDNRNEPQDIYEVSEIAQTLRQATQIQRVYAPNLDRAEELRNILKEVKK